MQRFHSQSVSSDNGFLCFQRELGYAAFDQDYESYGISYDNGSSKEMTLKKIYELALTAIAYLAFGIFVLQVIMCITAVRTNILLD